MTLLIVVCASFAWAALAPLIVRFLGRRAGWALAVLPASISGYLLTQAPGIADGEPLNASYEWVPGLGIHFSLYVDGLSLLFALLIASIGAIVLIYAGAYFGDDERAGGFFAYIILFMASMLGLVTADDVLTLYIFWELTSISSYFLISFDHEQPEARASAQQALLVTTGGGLALLAGLVLLGTAGGSFELSALLSASDDNVVREHALYAPVVILIALGAFTKSAQFPFHFWLPNAMVAPTPVSAYLHSATMVKAGIYLLARMHPLLSDSGLWHGMLLSAGGITMGLGAYFSVVSTDLKRILAYSTVAALGTLTLMLSVQGEEAATAAMAFIVAHALYKGALFLVAGAVDHETGERNVLALSGLRRTMPLTALAGGLAAAAMAGVPPFFGFIAKELLYEAALHEAAAAFVTTAVVMSSMFFVAAAAMAGIRPFWGAHARVPKTPHEPPIAMWAAPLALAVVGLACGLAPGPVQELIVEPAASSVNAEPADVSLGLWHGFNLALLLSGVTLAGGFGLFAIRRQMRSIADRLRPVLDWGPGRWYQLTLDGITTAARAQTRVLQNGYLRFYLQAIVVTTVGLVGYTLIAKGELREPSGIGDATFYELALAGLMIGGALGAVVLTSRLAAVASLGVVGYSVALTFVLFGAPDLAMTQVLVETLTVILFVLVFYHLPRFAALSGPASRFRDAAIALSAGGLITLLLLTTNTVQGERVLTPYFAENSYPLAHGRNVVNVILVDFRALDTLGEITVLAIAAVGVFALLKLRARRGT